MMPKAIVQPGAEFDWSLCRVFLAVARRGSLAGAVADLGMSHPTARRQLERLEHILGKPLFSRSQAGMVPTALAIGLLPHAEAMERAARLMVRASGSNEFEGTVRLAVCGDVIELIADCLSGLRIDHPGVRYELTSPGVPSDLLKREADIAIALHRPGQRSAVVSRLTTFEVGLFASRSWLEWFGTPSAFGTLLQLRCLVGHASEFDRFDPRDPAGTNVLLNAFAANSEERSSKLAAVAAGLGVGVFPVAVAARHTKLDRVLPELAAERDLWISFHPNLRHDVHVRLVLDCIRNTVPPIMSRSIGSSPAS